MKLHIKNIILAAAALAMTGCNNYLDVVPEGDITTIETTFEKREDALKWLKSCFSMRDDDIANVYLNPAYWGSDEVVADDYTHTEGLGATKEYIPGIMIAEGNQKTQNPYGNIWSQTSTSYNKGFYTAIRYTNLFLDQIDGVYGTLEGEKRMWKAQAWALKAHLYFELMRRYGPIILVPENIDPNADISKMQIPRSPIDSCVNATVELLDSAIAVLPDMNSIESDFRTFYTREGAATLKAMVLLYAASPLFNGNNVFASFTNRLGVKLFPAYDKEKWHRAAMAADEAIQLARQANHHLVSGSSDRPTSLLNTMYDIERSSYDYDYSNDEALILFHNHAAIPERYYHPKIDSKYKNYYDWTAQGGFGASMKIVEEFYTEHGLPLNEDKQWMPNRYQMSKETDDRYRNVVMLGTDVLNLHRRREPRFYADIISHGTCWYHKMSSYSSAFEAIECNMLQGQMYGTTEKRYTSSLPQCITGYYVKKFDNSTNQKYNYCNTIGYAGDRADVLWRLADLLLASSEAWNEYLDEPDERVYAGIDEVRKRAGIPGVREAWSAYARNPQNATTKAGMRAIIHQEENIEFAFEGKRFYNLRRWMTAPEELNQSIMGWNILGNTNQRFFNNFQGPIVVWKKRSFTAPRDYFFPINAEEILISGIKQNLGW